MIFILGCFGAFVKNTNVRKNFLLNTDILFRFSIEKASALVYNISRKQIVCAICACGFWGGKND
jgi:hypothetical protein